MAYVLNVCVEAMSLYSEVASRLGAVGLRVTLLHKARLVKLQHLQFNTENLKESRVFSHSKSTHLSSGLNYTVMLFLHVCQRIDFKTLL